MKTIKKAEFLELIKNEELKGWAEILLNKGFDLITHEYSVKDKGKKGLTYFTYHKNGKFGYVEIDYFGGFSLSSVYKPSRKHGTGAGYIRNKYDITLEDFIKAMDTEIIRREDRTRPVFYKDLNEFIKYDYFKNDLILIK